MKNLVLNVFLLVLEISHNPTSDIGYKYSKFSKTLLEKSPEFVSSRRDGIVIFNLDLILLLTKVNSISNKHGYKMDTLAICGIDYIKIVFVLPIKGITLNM